MENKKFKIVYCTPSIYISGGIERVLRLKVNYFADVLGYEITIILTDGKDKRPFYKLSEKVKIVNLDINFEEMWSCSFVKKIFLYLRKQRTFRKRLTAELMRIRPDITVSMLRREINFINEIKDGSFKIGELHVNKAHYRNFESNDTNIIKSLFSKFWMRDLLKHLRKLSILTVLTDEDKAAWTELDNVEVLPDPLSFTPKSKSDLTSKRVIAVGRYTYEKGFDRLLNAWKIVECQCPDWNLSIFGAGDRTPYTNMIETLGLKHCNLNGSTTDIEKEYENSSIYALSSRFEGFGMVLVEAMACGLAVVSFKCPCGPGYIINNDVDGLLVEDGNIEQLAQRIIYLIENPQVRLSLASCASENVKRFSIEKIGEKWQHLFESL